LRRGSNTPTISALQGYRSNRNRNSDLQISRAPFKSQAQGTSLFTSAATNQRGCRKGIVQGKLRSNFQRVRGDRIAVKADDV